MKELEEIIEGITDFAKSKLSEAYIKFQKEHDYDPRESGDRLSFNGLKISGKSAYLVFIEITRHDRPYKIEIKIN